MLLASLPRPSRHWYHEFYVSRLCRIPLIDIWNVVLFTSVPMSGQRTPPCRPPAHRRCGSRESPSTYQPLRLIIYLPAKDSNHSYLHHNLPCVNRQVSVVETPVELLLGDGLIRGIVVRCKVLVAQGLGGCYPRLGVKDQHALQQIHRYLESALHITKAHSLWEHKAPTLLVGVLELRGQRLPLPLRQRLDEAQSLDLR